MAFCGVKFGFLCSVFRVGWRIFVVFLLLGGGIGSLWVAFRYYGGIWQRNLTMAKNSPVLATDSNRRPPELGGCWVVMDLRMDINLFRYF
ncbi:hypothetical protein [Campylobacter devanensis]|uniref:hypothetical protein n=1 Tax=Campylobacter devanensis TaxID=3161138 RepID=UPI000A34A5A6|nr:hypothetical protein [Campylobacter sp. P155]